MSRLRTDLTGDPGNGIQLETLGTDSAVATVPARAVALTALDTTPESADAQRKDALYRLTERFYLARSLGDLYASALEAILRGLDCDRASILLFDDAQVMRFVAATGLSEGYQRAVEGHSPWGPDETDPAPVCVADFHTAEIAPALRRTILDEGIGAAAFIPLVADGRLIGKFMTYFDRSPHDFSDDEIALSVTIARQLAFAIERRRAAEALRSGEQRFRAMIDALPVAIYTTDAEGRLTHFNPAAVEFSGHVPELGTQQWCVSWKLARADGTELPHAQCPMATMLQGGSPPAGGEYLAIRPDGTHRWFTPYPTPMKDGNGRVVGAINMLLDITARKELQLRREQAERALVEQKRLYEAILTNTPDLAYIFDLEHRFIYANEGLLKMWGRTWDEAIGRTCLELGYEPWHAAMHDREIEQVISTRQPVRGEVPFAGTFGRRIYDYLFVPVLDAHGAVVAVAGTTRDVTELKGNEQRLREADRRKDEFLAMLAHELRNPLAPIANAIHILRLDGANDALRAQARDIIERQARQLTRLVDDLLEVSRITTGRIQLRREWTSIEAVVTRAEESVRPIVEKHGHVLTLDVPQQPVQVHADAARLEQVLVNLLNNAAKYTPEGGRIGVTVRQEGPQVEIAVRDSGVGIEPDLLPRIFELFTQAERSLDRAAGGLGVGLALARRLVQLHGGELTVSSQVGNGSEFTVRLPVSAPDTAPG